MDAASSAICASGAVLRTLPFHGVSFDSGIVTVAISLRGGWLAVSGVGLRFVSVIKSSFRVGVQRVARPPQQPGGSCSPAGFVGDRFPYVRLLGGEPFKGFGKDPK